jgi:putative membrane protein
MLDLCLAVGHHLLIFALFGVLVAELILLHAGVDQRAVERIGGIDAFYGALAGLIVVVGFSRAVFAAKGWDYYAHNFFFWAKIATFALIGVLSIPPTLSYIRWRRAGAPPNGEQIGATRRYLWIEIALFALLPIFAAAMARGYGEIG